MSDNVTSILNRYAPKEQPATQPEKNAQAAPAPTPPKELQDYQACQEDKSRNHQTRLKLYYVDGTVGLLSYSYLIEATSTSHQYLSLLFTNVIITLEGRNLTGLIDLLQDERIRWLRCFHPTRHKEPEADAPIITGMVREMLHEVLGG